MTSMILPPLRRSAADAAKFARVVHADQIDKSGRPYIEHLARVALRMVDLSKGCPFWNAAEVDEACQIAWLHDTIEDTSISVQDLLREGFRETVVAGVNALTKPDKPVAYTTWVGRLIDTGCLCEILVKLADVEDNSNPERPGLLDEATRERLTKKYTGAADMLRAAARKKGWRG